MINNFAKSYLKLISEKYKGLNLTNITNLSEFQRLQVDDSLFPIEISEFFHDSILNSDIIIDVGFGGGFPILPLALYFHSKSFLGIDAREKKVLAVTDIAKQLGVLNVEFRHIRLENLLIDLKATIVVKAVGEIASILSAVNSIKQLTIFFYKGPNLDVKEDFSSCLTKWNLLEKTEYKLNNIESRSLIGFKNKIVPCGTICKKNLVKLSTII